MTGPYAGIEQELFYRFGSLAFIASVGVPAVLLMLGRCRSFVSLRVVTAWLLGVPVLWFGYLLIAGGGV